MNLIDENAFIKALNTVAATAEGKVVLAMLKEYCRFDGDIVVEGKPEDTYANATLRRAYLYLRKRVHPDYLKIIEYDYKRKVETNDRPDKRSTTTKRTRNTANA